MALKLIREQNFETTTSIEESAGGKSFFIEGIFLQAGIKNRNNRIYPAPVMEREVNRYVNEYVTPGSAYGELGHPDKPKVIEANISHMITKLERRGNDWVGKAKILNTPMGNTARGIIEGGGRLAVSSRGMGSLKRSDGADVVQDDFRLVVGADIVADPGAPDAFVRGILEGKEWVWENGLLLERDVAPLADAIKEAPRDERIQVSEEMFAKFLKLMTERAA